MIRDLIVLGGGAGGLVVASGCAQLGMKVTLIEKADKLGGDCLHYGCVPSKTFIHSGTIADLMRQADKFGIPGQNPKINLARINQRVAEVIAQIQVHDSKERFESLGVEVLFGEASFVDKQTVQIDNQKMAAKRFVVATGSRPLIPPIEGIDSVDYLTNETLFTCQKLPEHLVVLGAGPIGIELGQAMARLGAKVTIIETSNNLLGMFDAKVADTLQPVLELDGISFELGTQVTQVAQQGKTIICTVQSKSGSKSIQASHLLIAAGRRPNTEGLGLDKAGVKTSKLGIEVSRKMKTTNRRIYAVGDVVASPFKLTHVAEMQAGVAIANIAFKFGKKVSYDHVPAVIYCNPEVASVGLGEQQLKDQNKSYIVLEVAFADIDRALAVGETEGFVKLLVHKKRLVGAVMVGPHVGELLAEVTLAIQHKLSLSQISATVHAYPTLSQVVRRTVNRYFAPKLFANKTKRLVSLLQKLP